MRLNLLLKKTYFVSEEMIYAKALKARALRPPRAPSESDLAAISRRITFFPESQTDNLFERNLM